MSSSRVEEERRRKAQFSRAFAEQRRARDDDSDETSSSSSDSEDGGGQQALNLKARLGRKKKQAPPKPRRPGQGDNEAFRADLNRNAGFALATRAPGGKDRWDSPSSGRQRDAHGSLASGGGGGRGGGGGEFGDRENGDWGNIGGEGKRADRDRDRDRDRGGDRGGGGGGGGRRASGLSVVTRKYRNAGGGGWGAALSCARPSPPP